ncbi:3-ketoacyl-ACP reductase [Cyclobacterium sp.]|uniref:3-ketoacyl-ACP reductase n=1 Tax=Cyclobacterium sp. TaxID=1966343 RepID=UPI0019AC0E4A|nr:3-ketoacyl-ACP reductase [Cyclobacterium sp.]MBD3630745.1 3-ketoacyl-ACP reductase [Cyclobacterium sp.]
MKNVALVTGGSRGIGLGIAKCLAKEGFDLAINGMREEADTAESLEELKALGADVLYCRGDVGSAKDRQGIMDRIKSHFNRLHVLVNNAGVAPKERKDILEATEESFEYVLKTNLNSAYFLSQLAANWMIAQKNDAAEFKGSIINVSSISATVASVNRGEYCVAKAGMSMATQLFAVRLGEYDIPVFEVRPGVIATDMTSGVKDKYDKLIGSGLCVQRRWGLPEDVGLAVAALAKGDFPYSTGQVIMVDGGLTIPRL